VWAFFEKGMLRLYIFQHFILPALSEFKGVKNRAENLRPELYTTISHNDLM